MNNEKMSRDEFAISIINAIVSNPECFTALNKVEEDFSSWANFAYDFADALIVARNRRYK